MPAVVVTGARQTGKSTLVRTPATDQDRLCLTLDDLEVMDQATARPADLLGRARRLTIDEVQAPAGAAAGDQARDRSISAAPPAAS